MGKKVRFDIRAANNKEEWLTPPDLVKALGHFDLDPCSAVNMPWKIADKEYTIEDDGLTKEWFGRVWLNPPYGNKTGLWLKRLKEHGNGLALIFARTDTRMFFDYVWDYADAILFLKGRIAFYNVDGTKGAYSGGAPSIILAYGEGNVESLRTLRGYEGKLICM